MCISILHISICEHNQSAADDTIMYYFIHYFIIRLRWNYYLIISKNSPTVRSGGVKSWELSWVTATDDGSLTAINGRSTLMSTRDRTSNIDNPESVCVT